MMINFDVLVLSDKCFLSDSHEIKL